MYGVTARALAGLVLASSLALSAGALLAGDAAPSASGEDALATARQLDDRIAQHRRDGRHREAVPLAREAVALRERALGPSDPAVAPSLDELASLLQSQGAYADARPVRERALEIRERALGPRHPDLAPSLNDLGVLLRLTGDYSRARALHERALDLRERMLGRHHPDVAESLNNLGMVRKALGDYPAARAEHERALSILIQAHGEDHLDVATSLNNLALSLEAMGDYAGALRRLERALRIRQGALGPVHPDVAVSLGNLGLVRWVAGDYAGARPLFEEAHVILEQALGRDHPDVATAASTLAQYLSVAGAHGPARALHERALRIREQALGPDHPDVATSLTTLGQLLRDTGERAAAQPLFERALEIRKRSLGPDHPEVATTLNALAYRLHLDGQDAAAEPLAARGLSIREHAFGPQHPAVAASLVTHAEILRARQALSAARPLYERGLGILRTAQVTEWRRRGALGLGKLHEAEGRWPAALALYQEAAAALDGLTVQFAPGTARDEYLGGENRLDVYDALADLLLKLHRQDQSRGYGRRAWAVLDAKKGRLVAEAFGETTLLARDKDKYTSQADALLASSPRYKRQFVDQQLVDPRTLASYEHRLRASELAVQYFAATDALWIFTVAPGGWFQVKRQAVSQAALYDLVKRYRRHLEMGADQHLPWEDHGSEISRREVAPFKAVTAALSAHLLEPIEAELSAHRELILISNDLLLHLPIHALTRRAPDGRTRFLVETHVVRYVTQAEFPEAVATRKGGSSLRLLALGNPDGTLPGASREVAALGALRPTVKVLEGRQATKAEFLRLAGQFPNLHLATHGVLDPILPKRSYLVMAGDGETDTRLTIDEIRRLHLPSRLAVLSACETAVGEEVPGAALITLAAAFSQAGSKTIVASLWQVNDSASASLMVEFHRALATSGPAAALRRAQLSILANPQDAHPYYWAPFLLIGGR